MNKLEDSSCRDTCQNLNKCLFMAVDQSELSQHLSLHTYQKNQKLFSQGNIADGAFCVKTGKIKMVVTGNEGKESIVRIVGAGDVIGHRALLCNDGYHASAIALEDTIVAFFNKEYFFSAIDKHGSVALNLLAQLSCLVGKAETKNATLIHKNVRERLAGFLLTLKEAYGIQESNRISLDIKLKREEMAAIVGTTRETLARLLSEFKNENIILQEEGVIFIINEKKLIEFANL